MYFPKDIASLRKVYKYIIDNDIMYFIIGNGTNVLINERYFNQDNGILTLLYADYQDKTKTLAQETGSAIIGMYNADKDAYQQMTTDEKNIIDQYTSELTNVTYPELYKKIEEFYSKDQGTLDNYLGTNLDTWNTTAASMGDAWSSDAETSIKSKVLAAYGDIANATTEYKGQLAALELAAKANFGTDGISGAVGATYDATELLREKTQEVIDLIGSDNGDSGLMKLKKTVDLLEESWQHVAEQTGAVLNNILKILGQDLDAVNDIATETPEEIGFEGDKQFFTAYDKVAYTNENGLTGYANNNAATAAPVKNVYSYQKRSDGTYSLFEGEKELGTITQEQAAAYSASNNLSSKTISAGASIVGSTSSESGSGNNIAISKGSSVTVYDLKGTQFESSTHPYLVYNGKDYSYITEKQYQQLMKQPTDADSADNAKTEKYMQLKNKSYENDMFGYFVNDSTGERPNLQSFRWYNKASLPDYDEKYYDEISNKKHKVIAEYEANGLTYYKLEAMNLGSDLQTRSIWVTTTDLSYSAGKGADKWELTSLDTGGYTGEWDSSGRLAMLHQKELVLNASDTVNMLETVNAVRDITSTIGSAIKGNVYSMLVEKIGGIAAGAPWARERNDNAQANVFNITAEFPNANSVAEIQEAILSLPNLASQYLAENRR